MARGKKKVDHLCTDTPINLIAAPEDQIGEDCPGIRLKLTALPALSRQQADIKTQIYSYELERNSYIRKSITGLAGCQRSYVAHVVCNVALV